tara:strand:+ start:266 stop:544 length:279 start_codon:yes stop_codon:yes gene_type:complete
MDNETKKQTVSNPLEHVVMCFNVELPTFDDCRAAMDDETGRDLDVLEPDPVTSLIYNNDTVVLDSSEELRKDIKELIEWCLNSPQEVKDKYT